MKRAQEQFARGAFWEAHETLEPLWLALAPPGADRMRAIIQLAAALYKSHQAPPRDGARLEVGLRRILQRARRNWETSPEALPAPSALADAFVHAAQAAERWAQAADQASTTGACRPPPVPGIALPLTDWSDAVLAVLVSPRSANDPERTT